MGNEFRVTNDDLFGLECLDKKLKVKKNYVMKKNRLYLKSYRVKSNTQND